MSLTSQAQAIYKQSSCVQGAIALNSVSIYWHNLNNAIYLENQFSLDLVNG